MFSTGTTALKSIRNVFDAANVVPFSFAFSRSNYADLRSFDKDDCVAALDSRLVERTNFFYMNEKRKKENINKVIQ